MPRKKRDKFEVPEYPELGRGYDPTGTNIGGRSKPCGFSAFALLD